jgi:class 3 adenylate cyclase
VAVYPDTPPTSYEQVHARTIAFTDDRESHAVRLALAAAPLGSFTLSVLHVLRERLVPEAALADIAEFLTAGLLTAISGDSDEPIYHFHPAAADHLESLLTRDQLWDTHFALSDHLESHLQTPHGIPVVLHSPHAEDTLAASARPIARAAVTTARLLGVEPTDSLPADTRRRPSTEHTADFSSKADGSTASTSSTLDDSLPTTSVAPVDGTAQERTVISITIDQFGRYNDPLTRHARQATYRVLEDAFLRCDITPELLIWHDIGDGVLVVADSRVSHEHLLGRWLTRVHQYLQEKNAESQDTLRLRIGISAGSDINLGDIPIGSTVSLAVRLSESIIARQLLEAEDAYLVVAITENIYINGVRDGHGYIDHELYAPSLLELKEGTTHAWFHVPGRTAPRIPSTWLLRQRPEGLAAVTRDLTHALGDIERALTEGFYPNLPSSRRTAYLLRVVADQLAGDDTGENVIMEQQPLPHDPHDEVPLTQDPLTEAVISACENLIGNEIGNAQTDGDWTLNGIDLPLGMHNLTLHDVTPNIASISWDIVEEYEYDLTLGQVTVEVELILEGYMNKGDAFIDSSVRILEDINSHMVEVSIERSAQLIFDARRESGIFELEFHGTSAPELNPHEPK